MSVSAQPLLQVQSSALSNVGLVRTNNEDSFLCEPDLGLYAVADGMGGQAGGEVASAMAIDGLRRALATIRSESVRSGFPGLRRLAPALRSANRVSSDPTYRSVSVGFRPSVFSSLVKSGTRRRTSSKSAPYTSV